MVSVVVNTIVVHIMSEMLMKLCLYMHYQCIIIIFVRYVWVIVSVTVVDCNFCVAYSPY